MRLSRNGSILATAIFATCAYAAAADPPPGAAAIPVGVRIPVALAQPLNSQTAHAGDLFAFKTTKSEQLGALAVPAGSVGHGRVAEAVAAHDKAHGLLLLQVDTVDLPDGRKIWIDIDVRRPPNGRLADRHTHYLVVPSPVGIFPALYRTQSGNMILDAGTPFGVLTTAPRTEPAPLWTPAATPVPAATPAPAASRA